MTPPSFTKNIGRRRTLHLPVALAFLAPLALGQTPQPAAATPQITPSTLKNLSLEQLSQIEVTSPTREPTSAFRSPTAIYVLTGEDIRRSGVTTIPDALRLVPGVEVAQIDSSKWSVGIRGFGTRLSRSVLVLIDGRTVYSPLFAGTYWEVQDTLLEDIERIEVIRGPGGTIWGPNAINGVINIITKTTRDTQGTYASGGGGNYALGFFNFRYGGTNGKGLSYRFYAKAYGYGPEYHYNHDNFDSWSGGQSGFRIDWPAGTRDAFTLEGDVYKQEDGERVSLTTYTPPLTKIVNGEADLSGGNLLFHWTRTLNERNNFQLQAFYDRTNRYEPNFGDRLNTYDLDFVGQTKIPWHQQLSYGVEGRLYEGHFLEVTPGLVFYPADRTDYLVSGFLQDDISLVEQKLVLSAGSKVLHTNYTGAQFQPNIRLAWTPTSKQTLWASFTHAVRTPSDAEEDFYLSSFLNYTPSGLPFFGRFNPNPYFAPEQLNGYELGYRQLVTKKLYIDIAGFFNHYHNLFSQDLTAPISLETSLPFAPSTPVAPYLMVSAQFQNDLYGDTAGGEIAPEWRPLNFWRLRGSYSYLNMNLSKAAGTAVGGTPANVAGSSPRNEVSFDSSFEIPRKVKFDFVYRYVSALPAVSAPAYSTGDARIAWYIRRHLEFTLVGRNLFQPYHIEYVADPGGPVAIRRNIFAALAWR